MIKEELNQKSPLRKLEAETNGGVGKGNIGVIASKTGVGKTACLVHIAVDKLLRGKHVIHVTLADRVDHISDWYEDIFKEIALKRNLESAMEVHDEMVKNRIIMKYHKDYAPERIIASLRAMVSQDSESTDAIIIDGLDFSADVTEALKAFKALAEDVQTEVWFSDSYGEEPYLNSEGIPSNLSNYLDQIKTILTLGYKHDTLMLSLVKQEDSIKTESLDLCLDPKTMLIC